MLIVFNIILIMIILLIAYWWANQGFFSALLHLLCVIVAGVIALAFWEVLTVGLLLRGGMFDNYAWGVSLLGLFAVSLFALRMASDKLVPANVDLPHGFNLGLGGVTGAAAGVLTVGFFLIGASFVQSSNVIMGWQGHQRSSAGQIARVNDLWVPYHRIAGEFYEWISVGALSTSRPLRHYSPDLYMHATAFRDTWRDGQGTVALSPKSVTIGDFFTSPEGYAVKVTFDKSAYDDEGRALIVSGAQVRLIGASDSAAQAESAYATGWAQYTKDSPAAATYYGFNSPSQYVTNVPGQQKTEVLFVFRSSMASPRFIQIKNVRYPLPSSPKKLDLAGFETLKREFAPPSMTAVALDPRAPQLTPADIEITNSIRPLLISVNALPSSMSQVSNMLSDGHGVFPQRGDRVGRDLQITGILEPAGTRLVQVQVGRRSSASLFGIAARTAGDQATPYLIDQFGGSYPAVGFINERPDGNIEIFIDPKNGIRTLDQLNVLLRGESSNVRLLFYVTEGVNIVSFRLNDISVGNTMIPVRPARP